MRRLFRLPTFIALLQVTGCGLSHYCLVPPSITGEPASQTVSVGEPAMFSIAAFSSTPLSYQWFKNNVAIAGATSATYTTPAAALADSGAAFTVKVSNPIGALTSLPAVLTVNSLSSATIRYVAPGGSDSNPGTITQPYQTIQHCATTVEEGWTCAVRAGVYRETVTPNSGMTITAYNLEPVTIDGSDPITGWTLYQGSIYKANARLSDGDTNQVFVANEMMTEARWPNGSDLLNINWATAQGGTDSGHIVDSNLPSVNWAGAKVHLWSGVDPFGHQTGSVTTSSAGQITINLDEAGTCPFICPVAGGYYYLFGTLRALDAEGEWVYDSSSSTLYFMAPGGVDPGSLDVRAKRRQYAIDLRGKYGVTISNVSLFASTIVTDASSTANTLNGINGQYVSHFTELPTSSTDPTGANYSILQVHEADSGIVLDGTGNILENSTIAYSAGAGVAVEGSHNTVRNNLIYNIDYIGDYASGIDLDSDDNTIQYNTIYNAGRQAIYINAVNGQDISYNNLFSAMMLSRDGGEIYTCCDRGASGTRIHHNWIHDTQSLISGAADQYTLGGVDIDDGSNGFNVDQNVLWNNQFINIFVDGEKIDALNQNEIHNNTVPDDSSIGRITVVLGCAQTSVTDNRVLVDVKGPSTASSCAISNNNPNAPGASEMSTSTGVGCSFAGCSSMGPPTFLSGDSLDPCPESLFAKP